MMSEEAKNELEQQKMTDEEFELWKRWEEAKKNERENQDEKKVTIELVIGESELSRLLIDNLRKMIKEDGGNVQVVLHN